MHRTAVLNIVGLSPDLIGSATPFLNRWMKQGRMQPVRSQFPAVTCSTQSTYLTGVTPDKHGVVANGWYFREMDEIKFWRQSNKLVEAPKIWERMKEKDPEFTCANLFWWYNMNSTVDYLATPRPIYRADGVKVPDVLTKPMSLRDELQDELGQFPLFNFWGPNTDISSSRWIAESAKRVELKWGPNLSLVYIPHLDYNLQRIGPDDRRIEIDLREVDEVCEDLITFYESRDIRVVLLSEYGIAPASKPVSLNRVLRRHGYITVREEQGGEILIPGSSRAFVVADHQIAHIYIKDPADVEPVRKLLEQEAGVERILDEEGKREYHLDHPRSGELVAMAEPEAWFTYYYWLDNDRAPDFAPLVDIHSKPGYDPAELLINPEIRSPKLKAGMKLLQKKLGFRYTMDMIPLDGYGVKGSHGRIPDRVEAGPLIASAQSDLIPDAVVDPVDVHDIIMAHLESE